MSAADALFAAADGAIFATFGDAATWKAGGTGPDVACTVIRERPDQDAQAFGTTMRAGAEILSVRASEVATPAAGDSFTVGAQVLIVRGAPQRDSVALLWRCEVGA